MNKKDKQAYKRMIDDAAREMVFIANKKAFEITDGVFVDILLAMREKIDEILEGKQQNKKI